jgi:hypothetical protein
VKTVRSVLNGLKWRPDRDFCLTEVEYVHRGVPGDVRSVDGADILALEPWMMVIRREADRAGPVPGRTAIPYHRILRVKYDKKTVFDRSGKEPAAGDDGGPDGADESVPGENEEGQP